MRGCTASVIDEWIDVCADDDISMNAGRDTINDGCSCSSPNDGIADDDGIE